MENDKNEIDAEADKLKYITYMLRATGVHPGELAEARKEGFLQGRIGYVPYESVEYSAYYAAGMERNRCAFSADLMKNDLLVGETWYEALRRHKDRILNPTEAE